MLNVLKEELTHQNVNVQKDNISMVTNVLIVPLNVILVLPMKPVLLVLTKPELKLQFVNVKSDSMKMEPKNVHLVLINVKFVTLIQTTVLLALEIESIHQNVLFQNKQLNQPLLMMLLLVLPNQLFVKINVLPVKDLLPTV